MSPVDARTQALAESRFFGHLAAFAIVTSVLLGVNLVGGGAPWAPWVGAAWSLVVVSHAAAVFGHVLGREWVERRAAALRMAPEVDAVRELRDRLAQLEAAVGTAERPGRWAPDPFDLGAAQAVGRPLAADRIGAPTEAEFTDDPFAVAREPIDTPRLDGPMPRR